MTLGQCHVSEREDFAMAKKTRAVIRLEAEVAVLRTLLAELRWKAGYNAVEEILLRNAINLEMKRSEQGLL